MFLNRKRKFAPKSHGGCHTCRQRHVRCTQEQPVCSTCTRSLRQCIYAPSDDSAVDLSVVFWQPQATSLARQPSPSSWDAPGLLHLGYYRGSICSKLNGSFDDPFWKATVCQLAECSPPIREAITTLALVWDSGSPRDLAYTSNQKDRTALKHYDKAVSGTRALIQCGSSFSIKEVLVCNLLFICLEMYQRHFVSALSQVSCGLYLYCTWQAEHGGSSNTAFNSDDTAAALMRIYRRLMTQSALFFDNHVTNWNMWTPHLVLPDDAAADTFSSIELARDRFTHLVGNIIHQSISARAKGRNILDEADCLPRPLFQFRPGVLKEVSEPLKKYRLLHAKFSTTKEQSAATSLEVQHLALSVLEAASKEPYPEVAFDKHMDAFVTIVRLSSSVFDVNAANQDATVEFSFDMEFVPPLYFVASRCRCPTTRRAAVRLLNLCSGQEDLWDSSMLARLAKKIIAIEEDGLAVETYKDVPCCRRIALTRGVIDSQAQSIVAIFNRRTEQSEFQVLHEVVAY